MSDAEKKRSSASAELQESSKKLVRRVTNVTKLLRLLGHLLCTSIENEIVLPLMKIYRYVKTNEPPSKETKRKVDMSTKESESQQYAGPSNLLADQTSSSSDSDETGDISIDEYNNLFLPNSFQEDCEKLWDVEYHSVVGAHSAINTILSLFRKLVYLEVFFLYYRLENETSRPHCRESAIPVVSCQQMILTINQIEINRADFDPEKVFSFTNEECKLKIISLCGKEEVILNVLLQLTKRILHCYFRNFSAFVRFYAEFFDVISAVVQKSNLVTEMCNCLKKKKRPSGNLELLIYFDEIDKQVRSIGGTLFKYLDPDAIVMNE